MRAGVVAVLLSLGATAVVLAAGQERQVAASLVEAERAFARLSVKIGQPAAFVEYFADNVMTFDPSPVRGKEALRARAASGQPRTYTLDWEPWVADLASGGDLGYTTGPYLLTEDASGKPLARGWYFSVWRKESDRWRVAADIGIRAPETRVLRPEGLAVEIPRPSGLPTSAKPAVRGKGDLLDAERSLARRVAADGLSAAYAPVLAPSARLYRDGAEPAAGARAVLDCLSRAPSPAGWHVVEAVVSRSADFAYTWGNWDVPENAAAPVSGKASFLHVWKAGADGWRLAVEVVNAPR